MVSFASSTPRSIAAWMRSRFTTLSSTANILLKPRFGSRRCSGIWPPSKPLMRTPVRAVWPLPPRPPVLPFPDPMPRPTRMRPWRAPALSEISLSFIAHFPTWTTEDRRRRTDNFLLLSSVVRRLFSDYAHEVRDFGDHPAGGRRVLKLADATDAIESEADKGLALVVAAPDRAADLLDLYGLPGRRFRGRHGRTPQTSLFGGRGFGIGVATARLQRRHLDVLPRRGRARRVLAFICMNSS